jgi:hypothetical protein
MLAFCPSPHARTPPEFTRRAASSDDAISFILHGAAESGRRKPATSVDGL